MTLYRRESPPCEPFSSSWPASAPAVDRVSLERGACFGRCPVYQVTVSSDGQVAFEGRANVAARGARAKTMPADRFDVLRRAVADAGFASFQPRYETRADGCRQVATDQSRFTITVHGPAGERRVSVYEGCEGVPGLDRLARLAAVIDQVADDAEWLGGR